MDMLMVLIALVAFTYFGGQSVPKILRDNKQILLGVLLGFFLQQFMEDRTEGYASGYNSQESADKGEEVAGVALAVLCLGALLFFANRWRWMGDPTGGLEYGEKIAKSMKKQ